MKIAFVTSEAVPFAKTGGLADVAGALPIELAALDCDIKVFMPKYYSVNESNFELKPLPEIGELFLRIAGTDYSVRVFSGYYPNTDIEIYFIDCPHFFHRHHLYTNDPDEGERFILFSKAVIETIQRLRWAPDILHCNDWQTGLIPLLLKDNYSWDRLFEKTSSVFTIHNIAYQGLFPHRILEAAEIKVAHLSPGGPVEHLGHLSFLKTGITFSDVINTVSETYAKEILTAEYGAGMQMTLNTVKDRLYGILNGVDYSIWNPETDRYIPYHYSIEDLSGKLKNKEYLVNKLNLSFRKDIPLIGIISRLADQKGFDLLTSSLVSLINLDAQWIILGAGERRYEDLFRSMAYNFSNKVSVNIGYDNELAHLIEAGADMFLMPSRYEPCGLNQIYSLKYGTVPIVRKTGGLADTVQDWNEHNSYGKDTGNGFSFVDYSGYALVNAVERAIFDFHNRPVWPKIQHNGMTKDYSWKKSAEKYLLLYETARKIKEER